MRLSLVAAHFNYTVVHFFFLGAKSTSIRDCVRRLVGPLVGPSVGPHDAITWKREYVEMRLFREEEEEEETDYVAIPLRRVLRT
jgi:hypothetical protein